MNHTTTIITLILLVAFLAGIGVRSNNPAVIAMAGATLTGLFALIQAPPRQ